MRVAIRPLSSRSILSAVFELQHAARGRDRDPGETSSRWPECRLGSEAAHDAGAEDLAELEQAFVEVDLVACEVSRLQELAVEVVRARQQGIDAGDALAGGVLVPIRSGVKWMLAMAVP